MKIEGGKDRLLSFRELYERAKGAAGPISDKLARHQAQYLGDDRIDGSSERASTVRNITYEIIESQVSSDIPGPKVTARHWSELRERRAEAIEHLLRACRDALPFEELNDIDERYTYMLGGSVWLVEWDDGITDAGMRGGVRVSVMSPRDFFPQPNVYRMEDMSYCFLRFDTTRDELCRRYGVDRETAGLAESECARSEEEDTVTVVVCYYRDECEEVSRFVFSGDAVLEDSIGYYRRRGSRGYEDSFSPGEEIGLSDGGVIRPMTPILDREGRIDTLRTVLPYYRIGDFPIVIRRNTSSDRSLLGQSDCEYIRPEQQAINKVESRILQKLMRAAVTPIVPEDATISVSNSIFGQVIRLRPGESAAQYGKVDTTPDISQDVVEAERLYDHAKRIVGISDTYQGMDLHAGNMSGYARQLQVAQSAGRLESKRRMKCAAYAEIDRLIFLHYLAYADEVRDLSYRDTRGRRQNLAFNRYDFYEFDEKRGEWRVDDGYLFSCDKNMGEWTDRSALWEENRTNLTAGAFGDPLAPETLLIYWQLQERAHYPNAQDQVEYFKGKCKEEELGRNSKLHQGAGEGEPRETVSRLA